MEDTRPHTPSHTTDHTSAVSQIDFNALENSIHGLGENLNQLKRVIGHPEDPADPTGSIVAKVKNNQAELRRVNGRFDDPVIQQIVGKVDQTQFNALEQRVNNLVKALSAQGIIIEGE